MIFSYIQNESADVKSYNVLFAVFLKASGGLNSGFIFRSCEEPLHPF